MKRSKEGALEELQLVLRGMIDEVGDPIAHDILSDAFIESFLDLAWKHQFDEDRSEFRTELRDLVSDAIEAKYLERA